MEINEILRKLTSAKDVSGKENDTVLDECRKLLSEYGEIEIGNLSNISVTIGQGKKHILLDAHMDTIGLIVTSIDKSGFLRIDKCGGIDKRVLAASPVTVLGKKNIKGVIISTPPHLSKSDDTSKAIDFENSAVDTGLPYEEIIKYVSIGDRIVFDTNYTELLNNRVCSSYLDDRAGMTVLLRVLELLKNEKINCKLTVQFSVQEETTGAGAKTGAFGFDADEAIAVDVSFGDAPDVSETEAGKLGKGSMICFSPSLDCEMSERLVQIAEKNHIPYQKEICSGRTGTNADSISITKTGIKTGVVSIPLRNMHTPCEIIDLMDIEYTAKLIAEYIKEI